MSWADVGEVIKAIAPIFTAGAACVGAYTGYRGLEKWRTETAGKRQADVAEQVLVNFYAARDTFRWVRTSGFLPSEGQSRVADDTEPEQIRIMKNTYFIPIERLNREKDLFSKLHAQRYSFMAIFGETKTKPFETVFRIHNQISATAHRLIQIAVHDGSSVSVGVYSLIGLVRPHGRSLLR